MDKDLRLAIVDMYMMVIFMRYSDIGVIYQVSDASLDYLSNNKIKLGGKCLYQNGNLIYYILRKYSKSRVTGRYNEVLPLLVPVNRKDPVVDLNISEGVNICIKELWTQS